MGTVIDWTKPIRRSDTKEPLHYVGKMASGRHIVEDAGDLGVVASDGLAIYLFGCCVENVPEKRTLWFNIDGAGIAWLYNSKDKAIQDAESGTKARIKVEYTEGRFDD
jgi:hypothetical protein